jgi:ubiquinone biosynthesis protein UbiJ
MAETVDDLMLEHLKKIQTEQSASRERDAEILSRLAHIETSVPRLARDGADNFAEVVADRHAVDKLKERIERIERRLELQS